MYTKTVTITKSDRNGRILERTTTTKYYDDESKVPSPSERMKEYYLRVPVYRMDHTMDAFEEYIRNVRDFEY